MQLFEVRNSPDSSFSKDFLKSLLLVARENYCYVSRNAVKGFEKATLENEKEVLLN